MFRTLALRRTHGGAHPFRVLRTLRHVFDTCSYLPFLFRMRPPLPASCTAACPPMRRSPPSLPSITAIFDAPHALRPEIPHSHYPIQTRRPPDLRTLACHDLDAMRASRDPDPCDDPHPSTAGSLNFASTSAIAGAFDDQSGCACFEATPSTYRTSELDIRLCHIFLDLS